MKKKINKKFKLFAGIVLVIVVLMAAYSITNYMKGVKARNTVPLETILEDASNLTTQKMVITDVFEISKGKIPIVTKNDFLVAYRTKVTAGFDVDEVEYKESHDKVTITIPHCTVDEESIKIKSDDLKIYDTNFAILNIDQNDLIEIVSEAENRAKKQANSSEEGFLEAADENALNLVKALYENTVDGKEIVVKFK